MLTLEVEPDSVTELFGSRVHLARTYASDLAADGERLGLIGPLELPRLWSRHILNCVLLAPLLVAGRVGDIGSGAGLPGMVLAIARPDVRLILIEPMERRSRWLSDEATRLGLSNVEVVRARAEQLTLPAPLDQVTARAVSSLSQLIPGTAHLLARGGEMLFMKGSRADDELAAASAEIKKFGLSNARVVLLGDESAPEATRLFRATVA